MPPEQLQKQPQITAPETPAAPPPPTKDKYKLFSAIYPAFRAMKHNLALLGLGALLTLILQVLQQLINTRYFNPSLTSSSQPQMQYRVLLTSIPFSIVGMVVGIFVALVIADGAHQEREQLGTYVRLALQRFWRVLSSYILAGLSILLPAASVVAIIAAFGAVASLSDNRLLEILGVILAVVGGLGIFVWVLATLIRYSLVGYIAMFDSNIPARQTMRRSRQLLDGTGEWFVVKLGLFGFILLLPVMIVIILRSINTSSVSAFQTTSIYTNFAFIPYGIFVSAMLVMLYLNRQATKPALDNNPYKISWKARTFIGFTVMGIIVLALSAPSLIRRNNLQRQQQLDQQAAQKKANIENNLSVYTNKAHGYALKLPKDFVLSSSSPEQGDIFRSQATMSPFLVVVQSLPPDPSLVYVNEDSTFRVLEESLQSFDNELQQLIGTVNTLTFSGEINIPGTSHKRGIFATAGVTDTSGKELSVNIIFIPKDDGTSVTVAITGLKAEQQQLKPVIDIILNSLDLRPK